MGDHYGRHEIEADRREEERVRKNAADAARIRALRDSRGLGMETAKRIVERENLRADIAAARTIDDIKALLLRMVPA